MKSGNNYIFIFIFTVFVRLLTVLVLKGYTINFILYINVYVNVIMLSVFVKRMHLNSFLEIFSLYIFSQIHFFLYIT